MTDSTEAYRLYDNKERAFVNQKEYKSQKTATQVAERRNQEFGANRYSAEKYSEVVQRNTPKTGGGGGGGGFNFGSARPGVSPSSDNLLNQAKGGLTRSVSRRADGVAQRGKTRGKLV